MWSSGDTSIQSIAGGHGKLLFPKECTAESYESHCSAQLFLLKAAFPKRAEQTQEEDEKYGGKRWRITGRYVGP